MEELKKGTSEMIRGTQSDEHMYSNTVYRLGQLCQQVQVANSIGRNAHNNTYPFITFNVYSDFIELIVFTGEEPGGRRNTERYNVYTADGCLKAETGICRMIDRVDEVADERRRLYTGWDEVAE